MRFLATILMLCCCSASLRNSEVNPRVAMTMMPKAPPPANTNGHIWLMWTPGDPPFTTLSNLTTRTSAYVGTNDNYQWSAPLGSTNVFVAFNQEGTNFGFSNIATGVATVVELKSSIVIHTFMVTMAVVPSRTNTIYSSTNLLTWQPFRTIFATNSYYQFVWTNDNFRRWFRTVTQ